MSHINTCETGYASSPEARNAAWYSLCLAAHGVIWGRANEFPYWDPEEVDNQDFWGRATRIKYLALP